MNHSDTHSRSERFLGRLHALRADLRRARLAGRRGMSLVEIMVVIVIMLTLLSVLGYGVMSTYNDALVDTTTLTMGKINERIEIFTLRKKKPPTTAQGLRAVFDQGDVPVDGWGNEFHYVSPGPGRMPYDIISLGADGKEGGNGNNADIKWSKAGR